jgi:hypothetical protein
LPLAPLDQFGVILAARCLPRIIMAINLAPLSHSPPLGRRLECACVLHTHEFLVTSPPFSISPACVFFFNSPCPPRPSEHPHKETHHHLHVSSLQPQSFLSSNGSPPHKSDRLLPQASTLVPLPSVSLLSIFIRAVLPLPI